MVTKKSKKQFVIEDGVLIRNQSDCKKCFIPAGVKTLGKYSFAGTGVEIIVCPASLEEIDDCAFCDCWNLKEIHLNHSLKAMGQAPFANCDSLKMVYFDGTKTDYQKILKGEPFGNVNYIFKKEDEQL